MDLIKDENGLNWQRCDGEGKHALILHRERICPLCVALFIKNR